MTLLQSSESSSISYEVPGYIIDIIKNEETISYYSPKCKVPFHFLYKQSKRCYKSLKTNARDLPKKILTINEFMILIKSYCHKQVSDIISNSKVSENESVILLLFTLLNLEPFTPLFVDDEITESHITTSRKVVIDHKKYGRLVLVSEQLSNEYILSLVKRCELEANQNLNQLEPSLKASFNFLNVRARVSIDSPPIVSNNFDIIIRRQKTDPFTIQDLINTGMLTEEQAIFLINAGINRKNIAIVGEPYSGKTTLANAVLLNLPNTWKIIIIEDTDEIYVPPNFINTTKVIVPPVESSLRYTNKENEITKLLHRSPDYVFVGEVQNKAHSKTLFEGYGAGIKALHTVHSDSAENLVRRWIFAHEINPEYLNSIDYIVLLNRKYVKNKVNRRVEKIYTLEAKKSKLSIFSIDFSSLKTSKNEFSPSSENFFYKTNLEATISL